MNENKNINNENWSVKMANSVIQRYELLSQKWQYECGLVLKGIEFLWKKTGEIKYFDYIKKNLDYFIDENGNINKYQIEEYNIDNINNGKLLFLLYDETKDERYKKAIFILKKQLDNHPRTKEGGFWHKKIYPYQMWLDGIFMASPFYAQYLLSFEKNNDFTDVTKQIILMENKSKDKITGLLYHGYDESRKEKWANKITGCSPNFWGRSIGWYLMAIVDTLDYLPVTNADRNKIILILNSLIKSLFNYQDEKTGLWFQVIDKPEEKGNYPESSASCMFIYSILKAIRNNYIDKKYLSKIKKAYKGVIDNFIIYENDGAISLGGICGVAGLGNTPYRDGSFEYYINEPVVINDFKGIGAFILASNEIEMI